MDLVYRVEGVARQTVLDRAHNGHGTDAYHQRGGDKALDKLVVASLTVGTGFQPHAQPLHLAVKITKFADQSTQSQREDHKQGVPGADGGQSSVRDHQHPTQGSACSNKQSGQPQGADDAVLNRLLQPTFGQQADVAAHDDGQHVGDGTHAHHKKHPQNLLH